MRQKVIVTHNPSEIDQELLVRFPNLGSNDIIIPGMVNLSFNVELLLIALICAGSRKQVHVYLTKNATSQIGFSITMVQFTLSAYTLGVLTLQVWVS